MDEIYWLHCNKCGTRNLLKTNTIFVLCSCQDVLCIGCFDKCPSSILNSKKVCSLCSDVVDSCIINESMSPKIKKLFAPVNDLINKYSINEMRMIYAFQKKQKSRSTKFIVTFDKKVRELLEDERQKLVANNREMEKEQIIIKETTEINKEISEIDEKIQRLQSYYNKHINEAMEAKKRQNPNTLDSRVSLDSKGNSSGYGSYLSNSKGNKAISLGVHKSGNKNLPRSPGSARNFLTRSNKRRHSTSSIDCKNYFSPLVSSTPFSKGNKRMLLETQDISVIPPIPEN